MFTTGDKVVVRSGAWDAIAGVQLAADEPGMVTATSGDGNVVVNLDLSPTTVDVPVSDVRTRDRRSDSPHDAWQDTGIAG